MKFGVVVQAKYFNGVARPEESEAYQNLLKNNFSQVGMFAFGQMPFVAKGPNVENDYDWKNIDALVNFGQKNGIGVLYNSVINSHEGSFPDWYKSLGSSDKLIALERHVRAIIGRYKDKISVYKLVNEARILPEDNVWGTDLSRGQAVAKISQWAKSEFPGGVYILNDHIPFLREDELREQYIKLIREVKNAGGVFDAIGLEGHLGYRPIPFQLPSDEEIQITLDQINKVSELPVHITEFDLSYNNGPKNEYPGSKIDPSMKFVAGVKTYQNWYEYQGYAYAHFVDLCYKIGYIDDLIFWGFLDDPKIDWERPGTGFFYEDFSPKPVFQTLKTILKAHN